MPTCTCTDLGVLEGPGVAVDLKKKGGTYERCYSQISFQGLTRWKGERVGGAGEVLPSFCLVSFVHLR